MRTHSVQASAAAVARQHDELGLAQCERAAQGRREASRAAWSAESGGHVEPQALVDRAEDAEGAPVGVDLLHELRAEHAHAADPLVVAQVPAAGEVGVVLRAGERERPSATSVSIRAASGFAVVGAAAVGRRGARRAGKGWDRAADVMRRYGAEVSPHPVGLEWAASVPGKAGYNGCPRPT